MLAYAGNLSHACNASTLYLLSSSLRRTVYFLYLMYLQVAIISHIAHDYVNLQVHTPTFTKPKRSRHCNLQFVAISWL